MALAVQFAAFAASVDDVAALGHEACRVAADGLATRFAKLLVYCADERNFLLQAGVGWRDGLVGVARLDADAGTAAGFAFLSDVPVVSNDLLHQQRFRVPAILAEHGIRRSINVVVPRQGDAAYGVLEVESPDPGRFVTEDVAFLQLIAGSLASAIERDTRRASGEQETARRIEDYRNTYGELCHRLRNDLQVVCASLDREGRAADNREPFDRVERQVRAFATLYDHLLENGQGEDAIDLGFYLQRLCRKITEASGLMARGITLSAQTHALAIDPRRAVQIGIAVNELIANAAEHAFVDALSGRIQMRLQVSPGSQGAVCALTVADDGRGFAKPGIAGLGLGFVECLAGHAGAVLSRETGSGTVWRLSFVA